MHRYILYIIFVLFSISAIASEDRVAIVVNHKVITDNEIKDRKIFLRAIQNIPLLKPAEEATFNEIVVESLIDDELILQDAERYKIKVTNDDLQSFIERVEETRKLPKDHFKNQFKSNKAVYNSFLNKMKSELVRSRLTNEVFLRQVHVSPSEVNAIAVRFGKKDTVLELREFSTANNDTRSYERLQLVQKLKNCSKRVSDKKVTTQNISTSLSRMLEKDRELINDLRPYDFSAIYDNGSQLIMYQVCSRSISDLSQAEIANISNLIGNKMLHLKFIKYLETVRKKAYIKKI